jgi:hypothetical protein
MVYHVSYRNATVTCNELLLMSFTSWKIFRGNVEIPASTIGCEICLSTVCKKCVCHQVV